MKQILTVCLLLIITSSAIAQDKKLQLAFITTPQLSWINSDNALVTREGVRLGYAIGLQGDYFFAPNYAISTSILYSRNGGRLKYNTSFDMQVGGIPSTVNEGDIVLYNLSYVEIPIGLKLKTNEFWRNTYWGVVGISPMVNTAAIDKNKNSLSEEMNLFNFGYHFGIGTDYSLGGSTYLTGAVILTNGLTDITRNAIKDKATMSSVNLKIGIIF